MINLQSSNLSNSVPQINENIKQYQSKTDIIMTKNDTNDLILNSQILNFKKDSPELIYTSSYQHDIQFSQLDFEDSIYLVTITDFNLVKILKLNLDHTYKYSFMTQYTQKLPTTCNLYLLEPINYKNTINKIESINIMIPIYLSISKLYICHWKFDNITVQRGQEFNCNVQIRNCLFWKLSGSNFPVIILNMVQRNDQCSSEVPHSQAQNGISIMELNLHQIQLIDLGVNFLNFNSEMVVSNSQNYIVFKSSIICKKIKNFLQIINSNDVHRINLDIDEFKIENRIGFEKSNQWVHVIDSNVIQSKNGILNVQNMENDSNDSLKIFLGHFDQIYKYNKIYQYIIDTNIKQVSENDSLNHTRTQNIQIGSNNAIITQEIRKNISQIYQTDLKCQEPDLVQDKLVLKNLSNPRLIDNYLTVSCMNRLFRVFHISYDTNLNINEVDFDYKNCKQILFQKLFFQYGNDNRMKIYHQSPGNMKLLASNKVDLLYKNILIVPEFENNHKSTLANLKSITAFSQRENSLQIVKLDKELETERKITQNYSHQIIQIWSNHQQLTILTQNEGIYKILVQDTNFTDLILSKVESINLDQQINIEIAQQLNNFLVVMICNKYQQIENKNIIEMEYSIDFDENLDYLKIINNSCIIEVRIQDFCPQSIQNYSNQIEYQNDKTDKIIHLDNAIFSYKQVKENNDLVIQFNKIFHKDQSKSFSMDQLNKQYSFFRTKDILFVQERSSSLEEKIDLSNPKITILFNSFNYELIQDQIKDYIYFDNGIFGCIRYNFSDKIPKEDINPFYFSEPKHNFNLQMTGCLQDEIWQIRCNSAHELATKKVLKWIRIIIQGENIQCFNFISQDKILIISTNNMLYQCCKEKNILYTQSIINYQNDIQKHVEQIMDESIYQKSQFIRFKKFKQNLQLLQILSNMILIFRINEIDSNSKSIAVEIGRFKLIKSVIQEFNQNGIMDNIFVVENGLLIKLMNLNQRTHMTLKISFDHELNEVKQVRFTQEVVYEDHYQVQGNEIFI